MNSNQHRLNINMTKIGHMNTSYYNWVSRLFIPSAPVKYSQEPALKYSQTISVCQPFSFVSQRGEIFSTITCHRAFSLSLLLVKNLSWWGVAMDPIEAGHRENVPSRPIQACGWAAPDDSCTSVSPEPSANLSLRHITGQSQGVLPSRCRFVSRRKADWKRSSSRFSREDSASKWPCNQQAYSSWLRTYETHTVECWVGCCTFGVVQGGEVSSKNSHPFGNAQCAQAFHRIQVEVILRFASDLLLMPSSGII